MDPDLTGHTYSPRYRAAKSRERRGEAQTEQDQRAREILQAAVQMRGKGRSAPFLSGDDADGE